MDHDADGVVDRTRAYDFDVEGRLTREVEVLGDVQDHRFYHYDEQVMRVTHRMVGDEEFTQGWIVRDQVDGSSVTRSMLNLVANGQPLLEWSEVVHYEDGKVLQSERRDADGRTQHAYRCEFDARGVPTTLADVDPATGDTLGTKRWLFDERGNPVGFRTEAVDTVTEADIEWSSEGVTVRERFVPQSGATVQGPAASVKTYSAGCGDLVFATCLGQLGPRPPGGRQAVASLR